MLAAIPLASVALVASAGLSCPLAAACFLDRILLELDEHDSYTAGHSQRVEALAVKVAACLQLDPEQCRVVQQAARLHDIGKVRVTRTIVQKPDKLDDREWDWMMEHAENGARMAALAGLPQEVVSAIRHHHERFDGDGYPGKFRGRDIPLASRIIGACDAFDAMVSSRTYSRARSRGTARRILKAGRGTQFDASIVEVVLELV